MKNCHWNPARPAAPGPAPPQNGGQRGVLISKHRNGRPGRAARFVYPVKGCFRPSGVVGRGILDAPFVFRDPPGERACPARAPLLMSKAAGKPLGPAGPGPGVHGGGGLYGQGRDRVGIAARSIGTYATGAAAPRAARIGITLQALNVVALYQLGPPGRRRCHASEKLWWLW